MGEATKEQAKPAHQPGPFHYAAFRHAFIGRTLSAAGSWMQTVAAGWLVFDLTHSASAVGVLTVASRGPGIVLSTLGGELADRYDRRRMLLLLYSFQALPAAFLAVVAWDDISDPFEVYTVTLLLGVASALGQSAMQQIITATVPPELSKKATGLGSVSYNTARLVGPAVGGVLVAAVGPGPCFAINAVSYFAVVIALAATPPAMGAAPHSRVHLRTAISTARASLLLRSLFLGMVLFSVFVAPIQELAPAISRRHGEGAHLLGFLLAALALGGLIGNWVRPRLEQRSLPPRTLIGGAMVACAFGLLLLAWAPEYYVAIASMILVGATWDILFVVGLTGVQFADPRESGLMTGLFFTVTLAGVTGGAVMVGALFDLVGITEGLLSCALVTVVAGIRLSLGARRAPAVESS